MEKFNLSRLYNKQAEGLYPKLLVRGEAIIRQGLDAGVDEHTLWLDWSALIKECILNPDFDTRTKFLKTVEYIKAHEKP